MASEATDEPPPVLSYVTAAPESARAPHWVHSDDGVRLVVPPPVAWRRMAGPAFRLLATTPFVLACVGALLTSTVLAARSRDATRLAGAVCPVVIGLAATGIWVGALTRLIRIARRGRQPFMLQVTNGTLEITPAADDPLEPRTVGDR